MPVNPPHYFEGTHISRFVEVLNEHRGEMTLFTLPTLLRELRSCLQAENSRVEVRFPCFLERVAPVSGAQALMGCVCSFLGEATETRDDFALGVRVPVTSLCPCKGDQRLRGAQSARFVTMQAYENPAFVKDMVRNAAIIPREDPRVAWFRVHAENQESIHNHDAFAQVEWLHSRAEVAPGN